MATIVPWLVGATAAMNIVNRVGASNRLSGAEEAANQAQLTTIPPEAQVQGQAIQGFADRGLDVGIDSPAVQDALRRRQDALNRILSGQQVTTAGRQAQQAFSGGDPFATLFGLFKGS